MSSFWSHGYPSRMSSIVSPAASMLRTCSTASRRPRMIGLPPKIFGFTVMLSRISSISWFHLFALFSPPPYQPGPANRESSLRQPPFPSLARADRRRLVEQPVLFLLLGQPGEFGHQRVPGWEERF